MYTETPEARCPSYGTHMVETACVQGGGVFPDLWLLSKLPCCRLMVDDHWRGMYRVVVQLVQYILVCLTHALFFSRGCLSIVSQLGSCWLFVTNSIFLPDLGSDVNTR